MLRNSAIRAEGIWKGYKQGGHFYWTLQGLDVEIMEGESIAVLGGPGAGKTTLLKVLGFREKPEKGQVYFQDRMLSWNCEKAIGQMQKERVWLLDTCNEKGRLEIENRERLRAVLLDEPELLFNLKGQCTLYGQLHSLNIQGVAVIMATCKPEVASWSRVIYKLKNGKLEKLTGKIRGEMWKTGK